MTQHATKNVNIKLSALTRVEYTETLTVPADISNEALNRLVNQRYREVDGSDFVDDAEFWERGTCEHEPADETDEPTAIVTVDGDGFHIDFIGQPEDEQPPSPGL